MCPDFMRRGQIEASHLKLSEYSTYAFLPLAGSDLNVFVIIKLQS